MDGKTKEAKRLILIAERKSIEDPLVYKHFGMLYDKMNMPERALLHYQNYLNSVDEAPDRQRILQEISRLEKQTREQVK